MNTAPRQTRDAELVDFHRKEHHKELHRRLAHEEAYQLIQRFPDTSYRLLAILNNLATKLDLDDTGVLCDKLLELDVPQK